MLLCILAFCVSCGVSDDGLWPGFQAATHRVSSLRTSRPSRARQSATSLGDDRVGYVPVGPTTTAQSPAGALAQTVAGLSGVIRSATLDPKPPNVPTADGIGVHVVVTANGPSPAQQMEGDFEAALLVGAVADRTTADGHMASVVKAYVVDYADADGTTTPGLWQPTNDSIVGGQKFEPPGDDREIERAVAETLAGYGMVPVSIEVLHPLDTAVKVIATIDSADAMNGLPWSSKPFSPAHLFNTRASTSKFACLTAARSQCWRHHSGPVEDPSGYALISKTASVAQPTDDSANGRWTVAQIGRSALDESSSIVLASAELAASSRGVSGAVASSDAECFDQWSADLLRGHRRQWSRRHPRAWLPHGPRDVRAQVARSETTTG